MKSITRAKLPNGEILTWVSLLRKYKIPHLDGQSAHVEWDNEAKINRKLPKVKVVYLDDVKNNKEGKINIDGNVRYTNKRIPKNVRETVWQIYNPNSLSGKCYCCGRTITHDIFEIGHDKAISKGGSNKIPNLRPICKQCNSSMGTMSIEEFKEQWFGTVSRESDTEENNVEGNNDTISKWKKSIRLLKELKNKIGLEDYKDALQVAIENLEINIENR